jgi:hypothetical protein
MFSAKILAMSQHSITYPSSSDPLPPSRSNDIFISYSRKDRAFVATLDTAFRKVERDPWIDWDDIRKGEDWWQSIQRGIEAANTFLFVVSPDSVASTVCWDEVEYATQCNKRFIPIVRREGFDMQRVHPSISRHNWLFFRETDDFHMAFTELLKALDTDLNYVHTHTRLLLRSLEWRHKKQDSCYLLRGRDLEDAQQWLNQGVNKEPRPTDSQVTYINASLDLKAEMLRARQKAKWIVVLTTVLANLVLVSGVLYWINLCMMDIAQERFNQEMEQTLKGAIAGINGNEFADLTDIAMPTGQDEPIDNPLYQRHQSWLQTINQLAPTRPITYIRGNNIDEVLIIGDVFRITHPEDAYGFRQKVPSYHQEMLEGFEGITLDSYTYEDADGSWVAIYGPIRNAAGESVGALELKYDATYVFKVGDHIKEVMIRASIISFIWLIISSWLILRATRPPHEVITTKQMNTVKI